MLPDSGANVFLSQGWCVNKIKGDHLHVSAYPLFQPSTAPGVLAALAQARTTGMSISLDLASSAPLESHRGIVHEACKYADVVFTNEEEARALLASPSHESRQVLHNRVSQLARITVVKQGPQGAVAISGDLRIAAPAPQVHVVDTTGAGDALAAGFLATWLKNGDLNAALESGVRIATEVVGRVGAGPYADVTRD